MTPDYLHIDPASPADMQTVVCSRTRSPNEMDAVATEVISAFRDGHYDEHECRRIISAMLVSSDIIDQTVQAALKGRASWVEDIRDMVRERITEKLLDEGVGYYDLEVAAGRSASGWLRKNVQFLVMQFVRDHGRAYRRQGTPTDDETLDRHRSHSRDDLVVYGDEPDVMFGHLSMDAFDSARATLRGRKRGLAAVAEVTRMFNVPLPVRPVDHRDRDWIAAELAADPKLAHRSLETFGSLVYGIGEESAATRKVDDRILGLWDDFGIEAVERLIDNDPRFAHALARHAVTPMGRPTQKAIAKMRSVVAAMMPKSRQWRMLTAGVVESWVACQCEPLPDNAAMSVEEQEAALIGHRVAQSRWDDFSTRALNFPGSPLGSDRHTLNDRLFEVASATLGSEFASLAETSSRAAVAV